MFSRYGSRINAYNKKPTKANTFLTHIFYASWYKNNTMGEVTVLDFSREDFQQILKAKTGRFDKKTLLGYFLTGVLYQLIQADKLQIFNLKNIHIHLWKGLWSQQKCLKTQNEMTLKQAIQAEKIYEKTGNLKEVRRIKVRIQEKFTLPFACLVFGLIGSSLGSKSNLRSSKSQGFGLSVILILIYYVLSFFIQFIRGKRYFTSNFCCLVTCLNFSGSGIFLLRNQVLFKILRT